jgi:hypothetical protein
MFTPKRKRFDAWHVGGFGAPSRDLDFVAEERVNGIPQCVCPLDGEAGPALDQVPRLVAAAEYLAVSVPAMLVVWEGRVDDLPGGYFFRVDGTIEVDLCGSERIFLFHENLR